MKVGTICDLRFQTENAVDLGIYEVELRVININERNETNFCGDQRTPANQYQPDSLHITNRCQHYPIY